MTGRRKHVAAILVALGLAMSGCGGDDGGDDTARTSAQSEQAPASETRTPTTGSEDRTKPEQPGESQSGGSTAPAGANATPTDDASPGEQGGDPAPAKKRKSQPKPATSIEDLSPAQRRKLHRDLYQQGKRLCGAYGPAGVAKSFNLPSSEPDQLARELAERYEAGSPSLVLPYQQGCIAGFRQHARKARDAGDGSGG